MHNAIKKKKIPKIKMYLQLILRKGSSWWVCQTVPVCRVCEETWQNVTQQGEGDLLCVQAEDTVKQLNHSRRPLLTGLFKELLKHEYTTKSDNRYS